MGGCKSAVRCAGAFWRAALRWGGEAGRHCRLEMRWYINDDTGVWCGKIVLKV